MFRLLKTMMVMCILLAGTAHAFTLPGMGKYEKVKPVNGTVAIPVASVNDGKAHFYRLSEGGKEIRFFVVKAADGTLRTAFDACDVCYQDKKGYEQQGNVMICKNCNKKFPVASIGPHAVGGCNPSYLPSRVTDGKIVMGIDDLRAGARYF